MADDFDIEAMLEAPYKKVSTLLCFCWAHGANAQLHIMWQSLIYTRLPMAILFSLFKV